MILRDQQFQGDSIFFLIFAFVSIIKLNSHFTSHKGKSFSPNFTEIQLTKHYVTLRHTLCYLVYLGSTI